MVLAWKITNWESYMGRLLSILNFDSEACWLNPYHVKREGVNYELRCWDKKLLKENFELKEREFLFSDGAYLVYNNGQIQVETLDWIGKKGASLRGDV